MADPKRAAKSGTLSQKEVLAITIGKQSDRPLCMQNAEMVANGDFFLHILMLIGENALQENIQ